jgi:hypothetical protein
MLNKVYKFSTIVVGSELNAVLCAIKEKACLLFNRRPFLHSFDTTDNELSVGVKKYPAGASKEDIWAELVYGHALEGYVPFGDTIEKIKIADDKLEITTKLEKNIKIEYEKLFLYDDINIINSPIQNNFEKYRVLDWFDIKTGARHNLDNIRSDSDFVKTVKFFLSNRIDGNKDRKDAVTESFLTLEQLHDVEYTDTMARFKTIALMKEAGVESNVKLNFWKRDIYPVIDSEPFILRTE